MNNNESDDFGENVWNHGRLALLLSPALYIFVVGIRMKIWVIHIFCSEGKEIHWTRVR